MYTIWTQCSRQVKTGLKAKLRGSWSILILFQYDYHFQRILDSIENTGHFLKISILIQVCFFFVNWAHCILVIGDSWESWELLPNSTIFTALGCWYKKVMHFVEWPNKSVLAYMNLLAPHIHEMTVAKSDCSYNGIVGGNIYYVFFSIKKNAVCGISQKCSCMTPCGSPTIVLETFL